MRLRLTMPLVLITALALGCVTTTPSPYPPFGGDWLYDYAASVNENGVLDPSDFGDAISKFDRDGRTEEHKKLEDIAHKVRAPEIIRIEIVGSRMEIDGGGGFKRYYDLSGLSPDPGVTVVWDNGSLEARQTSEGITLAERYELSANAGRLTMTITMDSSALDEPLEIRRVYTSAGAF